LVEDSTKMQCQPHGFEILVLVLSLVISVFHKGKYAKVDWEDASK
jgi:hypothetical protein